MLRRRRAARRGPGRSTREAEATGRATRIGRRMRKDGTLVDVEIVMVPLTVDGERTGLLRDLPRHHGAAGRPRDAEAANQAKSASSPHEPRDPDADERRHRDERAAARHRARRRAARLRGDHPRRRRGAAHDHQRHPRLLEDRGRPDRPRGRPVRLHGCVEGALELMRPGRREKGLELATRIGPGAAADRRRRRQAGSARSSLNLLANAIKFTEHGRGRASTVARTRSARRTAPVAVRRGRSDTGIGIPPDRIGRLFQSFSQADASTTRPLRRNRPRARDQPAARRADGRRASRRERGVRARAATFWFDVPLRAAGASRRARPSRPRSTCRPCASSSSTTTRQPPDPRCEQLGRWGMRACDASRRGRRSRWSRRRTRDRLRRSSLMDLRDAGIDGVDAGRSASRPPDRRRAAARHRHRRSARTDGRSAAGVASASHQSRSSRRRAAGRARGGARRARAGHAGRSTSSSPRRPSAHPLAHPAGRGQRREPDARRPPARASWATAWTSPGDGEEAVQAIERHRTTSS